MEVGALVRSKNSLYLFSVRRTDEVETNKKVELFPWTSEVQVAFHTSLDRFLMIDINQDVSCHVGCVAVLQKSNRNRIHM